MTYQDKIKAGSEMYNYLTTMGGLGAGTEVVDIMYKDKKYTVDCTVFDSGISIMTLEPSESYSLKSMNVQKITKQYVYLFAYDMMGNRTSYKMALAEMSFA